MGLLKPITHDKAMESLWLSVACDFDPAVSKCIREMLRRAFFCILASDAPSIIDIVFIPAPGTTAPRVMTMVIRDTYHRAFALAAQNLMLTDGHVRASPELLRDRAHLN
jgi:hypothetical protein